METIEFCAEKRFCLSRGLNPRPPEKCAEGFLHVRPLTSGLIEGQCAAANPLSLGP